MSGQPLWQIHRDGEPFGEPFEMQSDAVKTLAQWRVDNPGNDWTIEPVETEPEQMTPEEAIGHVVTGLVANYQDLYHNSPSFNNGVNTIAQLLPAWVDGLASNAERMDRMIAQAEAMRRSQQQ